MSKKLVNSVKKALDVLDILVFDDLDRKGLPLSELSRRTGIPANTLHALITTLLACGYVRQNPDSTYLAGHKIDDVGKQNLIRSKLAEKIPDILDVYREKTGESIVFYTLINAEKVPVHSVNRKGLFNINFEQLRSGDFFQVPTSRVIYAFASSENQDAIIKRWGMPGKAWNNIESMKELNEAGEAVRKRGYDEAVTHGGQVYSVAYPVIDKNNNLFGAVGFYAPTSECTETQKTFYRNEMQSLIRQISDILK
jgi:IclR family acetate operon transcriptional repressor